MNRSGEFGEGIWARDADLEVMTMWWLCDGTYVSSLGEGSSLRRRGVRTEP